MKREPLAMAQSRQFRGRANKLKIMEICYLIPSLTESRPCGEPEFAPNQENNLLQREVVAVK